MTKNIRLYSCPDVSTAFTRYAKVVDAVRHALWDAGVFYPGKPRKIMMYTGQCWSVHITGGRGRTVVTGGLDTLADITEMVKEVQQ